MKGSLLIAGTTSDAGKSVVTTGLCRALARRGVSVAPFKGQNMSNNSMVVDGVDGRGAELGRAQWIQAVAAGVTPEVAMNPVLLKPGSDRDSHVVLNGQPAGNLGAAEFAGPRGALAQTAFAAFDDLATRFDVVVCEGAGSPTEINLRQWDYVNFGLAQHASIPVVVVGDIDRGGLYAAYYGTVALLDRADQRLLAGFIVNKFRGDETLLLPANRELERVTGRPVLGVLPWTPHAWLDSEDGLDLPRSDTGPGETLRVAVVRFPRISNFTDVDALRLEPNVDVRFVARAVDLTDADMVVLPGTRSTTADLAWMRERGLDQAVLSHGRSGRVVFGICGGLQMLGRMIHDDEGVEGPAGSTVAGLGLLETTTVFSREKVLRLSRGSALGVPVAGYEIHHGVVSGGDERLVRQARNAPVFGTMAHGTLESDEFREALLAHAASAVGVSYTPAGIAFERVRQARLDLLADVVEDHLDIEAITSLIDDGPPSGLPMLAPGDAR